MSIFVSNHEIVITGRFGRPGALVLGGIFSLWDILAYGAGYWSWVRTGSPGCAFHFRRAADASLSELKALEAVQLFLDPPLQLLARPLR
ncbi:MAG: hypothetical protein WBF12_09875, partial [Bradyrhizobium sp.]